LSGVNYERINDDGLHISFGPNRERMQVLEVDNVVICAGQQPVLELEEGLRRNGIDPHVIGGAALVAELDAKRAIKQGTATQPASEPQSRLAPHSERPCLSNDTPRLGGSRRSLAAYRRSRLVHGRFDDRLVDTGVGYCAESRSLSDAGLEVGVCGCGSQRIHAFPHRHVHQLIGGVGRERAVQPKRTKSRLLSHDLAPLLPSLHELVDLVWIEFEDVDERDGPRVRLFGCHNVGIPHQPDRHAAYYRTVAG